LTGFFSTGTLYKPFTSFRVNPSKFQGKPFEVSGNVMADIVLTDANFDEEVLKSDIPVLVDFYAEWCPPCKMLGPIIEELATEYQGKAKVCKLNVDQSQATASRYGIMSLPTIYFFKGGQPVKSLVGIQSKENFKTELDQLV